LIHASPISRKHYRHNRGRARGPDGGARAVGSGTAGGSGGAGPRTRRGHRSHGQLQGFRFDIGGHRFFSKNAEIEQLWRDILGDRMLERERLSRIYYRGRFFKYPLETWDALSQLGIHQSAACMLSYLAARVWPRREIRSFEDWVVNAFGRRLYETFFRSYTEKVWGIPCSEISADWAAQRIKDLSMRVLIRRALGLGSRNGPVIKTLIDRFRYPLHGPGEMWEQLARTVQSRGTVVKMGESVTAIQRQRGGA
jgi:protoporphyrinogen oxidase